MRPGTLRVHSLTITRDPSSSKSVHYSGVVYTWEGTVVAIVVGTGVVDTGEGTVAAVVAAGILDTPDRQ